MSFDWKKYQEVAERLSENGDKQEYARSAISRAYYSVFNQLRIRVGYNSKSKAAELSHVQLIEMLKSVSDEIYQQFNSLEDFELQFIGNQLDLLRRLRNEADYNGSNAVTLMDAKTALAVANEIRKVYEKDYT